MSADPTLALTATIADALTEGLELKAPVDWVIKEGSPQSSRSWQIVASGVFRKPRDEK